MVQLIKSSGERTYLQYDRNRLRRVLNIDEDEKVQLYPRSKYEASEDARLSGVATWVFDELELRSPSQ
jgi:hypothetical protein